MSRKFTFTEKQIKSILGEDFTSYLDKSDNGFNYQNDYLCGEYSEIKPEDRTDGKPVTTDKIAGEKIATHPWIRKSYNTLYEVSQDIDGMEFGLGSNTNKMIDAAANNNTSDVMLKNMSTNKNAPIETLYTRLRRIREMKTKNPNRYQQINGAKLENAISAAIERAKETGKSLKNTRQRYETFKSNQKITSKGGHRKNPSTITYYDN